MAASNAAAPSAAPAALQVAVLDSRLKNMEAVMSNCVLPALERLDRLEVWIATMERLMVGMGATVAAISRQTRGHDQQNQAQARGRQDQHDQAQARARQDQAQARLRPY